MDILGLLMDCRTGLEAGYLGDYLGRYAQSHTAAASSQTQPAQALSTSCRSAQQRNSFLSAPLMHYITNIADSHGQQSASAERGHTAVEEASLSLLIKHIKQDMEEQGWQR